MAWLHGLDESVIFFQKHFPRYPETINTLTQSMGNRSIYKTLKRSINAFVWPQMKNKSDLAFAKVNYLNI